MKFKKYQQNLTFNYPSLISYTTKVAEVKNGKLVQLGWWSVTTQKQLNYAADELNHELDRNGY